MMGGTNSGPASVKCRAFDLAEFSHKILNYLKWHLQSPEDHPLTDELVEEWKGDLDLVEKHLKQAIEPEKQK